MIFLLKEESDTVELFLVGCCVQNGLENCEKERKKMPMNLFPSSEAEHLAYGKSVLLHRKNSRNYKAAKMGLSSYQRALLPWAFIYNWLS